MRASPTPVSVVEQLVFTADSFSVSSEEGQVSGCGGKGSVHHMGDNLERPDFGIQKTISEVILNISQRVCWSVFILKLGRFVGRVW